MRFRLLSLAILCTLILGAQRTYINTVDNAVFGSLGVVVPAGPSGHVLFTLDQGYMVRYDVCGNELFAREIDLPGNPELVDLIALSNGDFGLLAASANIRRDAIVARLDSAGNLLWVNQYQDANFDQRQFPYSLVEISSDRLCYYANMESLSTNDTRNLLLWLDAQGAVVQAKTYNLGGIWGRCITTADSGLLFRTGNRLVKVNELGFVQWAREYVISNSTSDFSRPIALQDGYAFFNRLGGSNFLVGNKVDLTGQLTHSIRFNAQVGIGRPVSIGNSSVGLALTQDVGLGQSSATFLRLGGDSLQIERRLSLDGLFGTGRGLCMMNNGKIAFAGAITDFPSKSFSGITDQDLNSSCRRITQGWNSTAYSATDNALAVSVAPATFNAVSYIANVLNPNLTIQTQCIPVAVFDLGQDTALCVGDSLRLANVNGYFEANYSWSTGSTDPSIYVDQPGTYWVEVDLGCGSSILRDSIEIGELANESFSLGPPRYICEGEEVIVSGPDCASCGFQWNTGESKRSIVVRNAGIYRLTVQYPNGCEREEEVEVFNSGCACDFFMPDAFSPNGDDRNEVIRPILNCVLQDYRFTIYDRWGMLVFDSRSPEFSWNGRVDDRNAPSGIFMYSVEYSPLLQGEIKEKVYRRGTLVLLR